MGANANIFDSITTGDIDLFGGGIGNHGVSGKDLASIFNAIALAEQSKEAERDAERAAQRQILLVGGGLLYFSILITIIYIIYKRQK